MIPSCVFVYSPLLCSACGGKFTLKCMQRLFSKELPFCRCLTPFCLFLELRWFFFVQSCLLLAFLLRVLPELLFATSPLLSFLVFLWIFFAACTFDILYVCFPHHLPRITDSAGTPRSFTVAAAHLSPFRVTFLSLVSVTSYSCSCNGAQTTFRSDVSAIFSYVCRHWPFFHAVNAHDAFSPNSKPLPVHSAVSVLHALFSTPARGLFLSSICVFLTAHISRSAMAAFLLQLK